MRKIFGEYEFKGSKVLEYRSYYEDDCIVEEIETEDGKFHRAKTKITELDPVELKNLIDAELSD